MELGILVGGSPVQMSKARRQLGWQFARQIREPGNGSTSRSAHFPGIVHTAESFWFPFKIGATPLLTASSCRVGVGHFGIGGSLVVTNLGQPTCETYGSMGGAELPALTTDAKPFRGRGFAVA